MVEFTDTPIEATRSTRMRGKQWVFITVVSLLLSALSWGMDDTTHVGSVAGLDVQVEFLGFKGVGPGGTYKYEKGKALNYRVTIKNKSNVSFARVEAQSSLISDGFNCLRGSLKTGSPLPGSSVSRKFSSSLTPGATTDFEVSYDIPSDMCSSNGHLSIRLQYVLKDRTQATILVAPLHFRME